MYTHLLPFSHSTFCTCADTGTFGAFDVIVQVVRGPTALDDPSIPPQQWQWPELDEALGLTTSQKTQLAQQLHTTCTPPAATPAAAGGPASTAAQQPGCSNSNNNHPSSSNTGLAAGSAWSTPAQPAAGEGAQALGASPATAAAAEQLLSVVAAAAAEAGLSGQQQPRQQLAGAVDGADDVVLVPQLCLMLYDSALHSFGYTESAEMDRALTYMAARVSSTTLVGG